VRGPDFFDTARFPEAVFESNRIEKTGTGYVAHGRLTIRDITREIDLPFAVTGRFEKADDKGKLETLGFAPGCTINRRDFGMLWKHSGEELFVGDLIDIEILLVTRATRLP
jgi:polyisoprenoid-binding protein YceI